MREKTSEWVLHCAVNQRHIRRSQPTRDAALEDAYSQLLQGHAVNRIVGPNETVSAKQIKDWCAKHRPSDRTPTHGYAATREVAMAAFAKSWRRE
jgi:hypothetical protein